MCPSNYYRFWDTARYLWKNRHFYVPGLHLLFALGTPLRLSRNLLHGWKGNSMLAKPSQHIPIYIQYFPSYTMLKSMLQSKNHYFYHIFCFPWGRPWGNHAKCCIDGKRIRCLQFFLRWMCPSILITVSQIERDIGQKLSFFISLAFDALVRGVPVGISPSSFGWKN